MIIKTFKWQILAMIVLGFGVEGLAIGNLFFTSVFLDWLRDDGEKWLGFLYAFIFSAVFIANEYLRVNYFYLTNIF